MRISFDSESTNGIVESRRFLQLAVKHSPLIEGCNTAGDGSKIIMNGRHVERLVCKDEFFLSSATSFLLAGWGVEQSIRLN